MSDTFQRHAPQFFNYARERYNILLNRRAGLPREEWTVDPVLKTWSFCNIFREDDKVTEWFRTHIRDPLKNDKRVLFATIAFRWFNSINAGEVLKPYLLEGVWPVEELKPLLEARKAADGKIVTGAYIIKTPPKLSKIDALLHLIALTHRMEGGIMLVWDYTSLERSWDAVRTIPYMGDFTSYEVVTDLRHTKMLRDATDVHTWANPGPGCAAGLGELFHQDRDYYNRHSSYHRKRMMEEMQLLLAMSQQNKYWSHGWPQWELREVEHTLCEFDKYRRGQQGLRLKRRYR